MDTDHKKNKFKSGVDNFLGTVILVNGETARRNTPQHFASPRNTSPRYATHETGGTDHAPR